MSQAHSTNAPATYVDQMAIDKDAIVLEIGWYEDCDSSLSEAIEERIGQALLDDPDTDEVVDGVLLWFRADDRDLVDALVDTNRPLAEAGEVWLVTPGAGHPGTVPAGDIAESAQLAGLVQTSMVRLGDWQGSRLVQRGNRNK